MEGWKESLVSGFHEARFFYFQGTDVKSENFEANPSINQDLNQKNTDSHQSLVPIKN